MKHVRMTRHGRGPLTDKERDFYERQERMELLKRIEQLNGI